MAFRFLSHVLSRSVQHVTAAVVNTGGTGHAIDDVITMALGTGGAGTACQLRVTAVSSGAVTSVSLESSGSYTTAPSPTTGIAQSSTTGSGTGFTADLTFALELGYIQSSKAILDWLTRGKITSVAVVAAGTGYVVDDLVELNSGTSRFLARFQVTSVDGSGGVTGLQMVSSGSYDVLPDTTAASHPTTGGVGSGLTVTVGVEGNYSAAVNAGGVGYVVGEVVTLTGGALHTGESAATFVVTSVSTGVVTGLAPLRVSRYDTPPSNPVSTTASVSGAGLTIDLTQVSWTHSDSASENYVDGVTNFNWWVTGVNNAGGAPVCGVKTESSGASRWLGLKVATSFDDTQTFDFQPNASPNNCRLPSTDSTVTLFAATNVARSMNIVSRTAPTYEHGYMGLFTPFIDSPNTKYPFPLVCAGTTISASINSAFSGRNINLPGAVHASILHHPETSQTAGPYFLRDLTGNWRHFAPSEVGGAFRMWPFNSSWSPASDLDAPDIASGSGTVTPAGLLENDLRDDQRNTSSIEGPFNVNDALNPSPFGSGGRDLYFLVPPIMVEEFSTTHQIYGELEGVLAINGRGLSAEDRIQDDQGATYFVFTDTLSNENRNFIAVREGD